MGHRPYGGAGARPAALHHISRSGVRRLRPRVSDWREGARLGRSRTSGAEAGRLRWLRGVCDGMRYFAVLFDTEARVNIPYRVEKPWGYEIIWAKADRYVGKILHIEPGHVLSLQYHNKKDESI